MNVPEQPQLAFGDAFEAFVDALDQLGDLTGGLVDELQDELAGILWDFVQIAEEDAPAPGKVRSRFLGGDGDDVVFGTPLNEPYGDFDGAALFGGDGDDTLTGTEGTDLLIGGTGADVIGGGGGGDLLLGNAGADSMNGGNGSDILAGGSSGDALFGGSGRDTIFGGDGGDVIRGNHGADLMFGESGADRFVFQSLAETGTFGTPDAIADFGGGDRIDLRPIDANAGLGGNQSFDYVGAAAFSGTAGELRFTPGKRLMGDTDGDGDGDFAILLVGVASLAGTDILV